MVQRVNSGDTIDKIVEVINETAEQYTRTKANKSAVGF